MTGVGLGAIISTWNPHLDDSTPLRLCGSTFSPDFVS